jgi:hypothetical protein
MWAAFAGETVFSTVAGNMTGWTIATVIVPALGLGGLAAVGIIAIPSIALGYYAGKITRQFIEIEAESIYGGINPSQQSGAAEINRSIEIELLTD